jgi:hypothetical protein
MHGNEQHKGFKEICRENKNKFLRQKYFCLNRAIHEIITTNTAAPESPKIRDMAPYRCHLHAELLRQRQRRTTSSAVRCTKNEKLRNELTINMICFAALYVVKYEWS